MKETQSLLAVAVVNLQRDMCQDYQDILEERKIISEKMAEEGKMETIPFDPRFPNQNQTRNCWQNYVDFHRCQKIKVGRWEIMAKAIMASYG